VFELGVSQIQPLSEAYTAYRAFAALVCVYNTHVFDLWHLADSGDQANEGQESGVDWREFLE